MSLMFNARRARWVASLSMALAAAVGCSETAELASALSETGDQPVQIPGPRGEPVGSSAAVECKSHTTGGFLCVTCADPATGKTVREDCHWAAGGDPVGVTCAETREADGRLCMFCRDRDGNVIKRGCQTPPNTCRPPVPPPPPVPPGRPPVVPPPPVPPPLPPPPPVPPPPVPPPLPPPPLVPPPPVHPPLPPPPVPPPPVPPGHMGGGCREAEVNGLKCTICVDANGRELRRWCQPAPGTPPEGITCEETSYPDGTNCAVCTDARGNIVKKGCWSPVPQPPPAPMVTCKGYEQNGSHCVVCVDEKGAVIRQGCSPAPMTDPNTMPPPPGMSVPPPPPVTAPGISCQRYSNATSVCTICVDQAGKIVKQDCQPVAPPPPG